ncbi:MAG: EAL domain-containing protein, partial [Catonella sp.]|nr:EAL domain-containing protein [Catonella sp.]
LSPYQFIPTLEKYHLIWKLDFYMLGLVLKDLSERKHDGLPIYPVSINLAREDFEEENAVGQLLGRIDSYDIDRKYIIMEVTERDLAANDMHFKDVIDTLRSEGFSIWVDDFGSGYSSLNVMNAYKFDLIKLDMNFLRHLDDYGGANRVIMSSVIEAAHKLGITTLAEGVETEEHLNFLKEVSCDESQGYLYSKPKPLENLVDIL